MNNKKISAWKPSSWLSFLFVLLIFVGSILMIAGLGLLWKDYSPQFSKGKPTDTAVNIVQPTETKVPPTPTLTPYPTDTETPTALPYVIEINTKDQEEMVLVPSGEFTMGSDPKTDPDFWGAEGPEHTVFLDSFYIYRTEVTNAMYLACVEAKACPRPSQLSSATRESYFDNSEYYNYPVIYVSWVGALSYCHWVGAKLPTEAQWEKAARGTDLRLFPWGDDLPSPSLLNYNSRDTVEVGLYPKGISPYGAFDMAGNVMEWVNDRFQSGYYNVSPLENPIGPAGTDRRVIRGGAWEHSDVSALRTVARASLRESYTGNNIGFRCVVPAP